MLKLSLVMFADEYQIEQVTSKVALVDTMHDGLRLALEGLRRDIKDGEKGPEVTYSRVKQGVISTLLVFCSGHISLQAGWHLQFKIC